MWFTVLVLSVLVVSHSSARRRIARGGDDDDDDDDGTSWLSDDEKRSEDGGRSQDSGSFGYDEREHQPGRSDCDADSFRRGQAECDRILRMNLPHHHGNHDYVCYSLRKYKMCVANVMIQSSCYERSFISQELHKIRGIIQGYSVDCFNITKETNQRIGHIRRMRYRMSRARLSPKCSPASAWSLELKCTKDFQREVEAFPDKTNPQQLKHTCSSVLRYYNCLSPLTRATKCKKSEKEFIQHIEYFPRVLTIEYRDACRKDISVKLSLFSRYLHEVAHQTQDMCREVEASREFLACALVFNEVINTRMPTRICEAYMNFIKCAENIASNMGCTINSEYTYHSNHVLMSLLYDYQGQCGHILKGKRGRSLGAAANRGKGMGKNLPHPAGRDFEQPTESPRASEDQTEGRRKSKFQDFIYKATTVNPDYPPEPKIPFGQRPRDSDEGQGSNLPAQDPGRVNLPSDPYRYPLDREDKPEQEYFTSTPERGDERQNPNWNPNPNVPFPPPPVPVPSPNEAESEDNRPRFFPKKAGRSNDPTQRIGDTAKNANKNDHIPVRNDAKKDSKPDDGYPPDPNDGFLEDMDDMDMEAVHKRRKKLHKRRLHPVW